MESTDERQELEITALKSIYAEDFVECPPPKVWKGAPRLPEFIIKVTHSDPEYADKIYFHLHTKFPKTYPTIACPTFTIQQPIQGLKGPEITRLSSAIHAEAQRNRGSEMVFQIVTFAQEWITSNVSPPVEVVGSLATEMNKRAYEEERAKRQREEEEAEQEEERAAALAQELEEQIRADVIRQQLERERVERARKRAVSDSIETDISEDTTLSDSFAQELEWRGVRFSKVKLFHPQPDCLGTIYQAEPVCDNMHETVPLELLSITFHSQYYTTSQGRKKLKQLESEIQRLTVLRHRNLLAVIAVKLTKPNSSVSPRLLLLSEQRPAVTMHDVLEDCDWMREDRAADYLVQILSALQVVHSNDLVHRGLSAKCIGLSQREEGGASKVLKLFRVGYHVRLLDLHRSNPFGFNMDPRVDEPPIPEGWLPLDAIESPLVYTRSRDIHAVGIVLLQMLMGRDVLERFPDVYAALRNSTISPTMQQQVMSMLVQNKKHPVSCLSLLSELQGRPRSPVHTRTPAISILGNQRTPGPKTPTTQPFNGSPDTDYFRAPPPRARHASRWKEDWEELELLGRGAFGSVVKARNKIDNRIYAVKKIKLRAMQSDSRIFREVNALSRLNHRFIVRYYTTWVETSEPASTAASSDSDDSTETADGDTSVPDEKSKGDDSGDPFSIDLDDLDTGSRHSFPSIHFTRSGSATIEKTSEGTSGSASDSDDAFGSLFAPQSTSRPMTPPPTVSRTLYIQMEFVERQTLKERIAEGITEEEAWRLFQQIVDALVHMSSLGILHRDIKLTNIFIDGKGDCKVGDFGLATSSLAAVDPSDVTMSPANDAELTLDVGTRLYIAPEVQSSRGGPRDHTKADMYSLGIVFFEMNYMFTTGSERITVLEDLRKTGIFFPPSWDPNRARQRQIITWLLQHNPNDRPSALELSQSSLLPPRLEDEYFKGALKMMTKKDSPYLQSVLSSLFNQPMKPSRGFLYDSSAELPEHATLNGKVVDVLVEIFRLHGAVSMEPPLLIPVINPEDERNRAVFLDRHGEVVSLPNNALLPFARLAARQDTRRIKRFHIGDIYRPNIIAGHPRVAKAAVFDIISPDLLMGPSAAAAEGISIVNECLNKFANVGQYYEIHISHSRIFEIALDRIPAEHREAATEVLNQTKSSQAQKRLSLLRKGIARNIVDELETLSEVDQDIDAIMNRLEKVAPPLVSLLTPYIKEVKSTIQFANAAGVTRPIFFDPLMLSNRNPYFKDGICFEVVNRNKRSDILAAGGRYDNLIARLAPLKPKSDGICAVAVQISLEKITFALAAYQSAYIKTLLREQRSFGFWSPRRCDVYVVSYQPGYLAERLEVAAMLWQHNISSDVMYESSLPDIEQESHIDICYREGILFIVYPRPRAIRRDLTAFKVKSVLRGTEYEVTRQELVPFLYQQLMEQKRIDLSISGVSTVTEAPLCVSASREATSGSDVQLVLPGDTKKKNKHTKQMFLDRAFDASLQVKNAAMSGMPTLAVDVPPSVFEEMTKNTGWITDEDAWKAILANFPAQHTVYAHQVKEAVIKRKMDGHKFILLFSVRDERMFLLNLS
ncbi:Serine/threonine-protein kinase [Laetiporus sulphureus 93-53]|uniref:non-specific serine/threonine protein kinase n=1 Tax=Laetiporus sulphureus 93-53 TaxID=1314785 RepID=A0A165ECD8_9APHY|nr:Serine/threonine-protein kinase [Laetiporus sulphureus 93-53]KZT06721.1 Serine/threonine-protein kinase [Laetiporus sulphureus 93-53]